MDRQLPPSTGYSSITQNVGSTRNTGLEVALTAITLDGWHGLHWTNDVTWSKNKNEILTLNGGKIDDPGNTWFIGQPINGGGNNGLVRLQVRRHLADVRGRAGGVVRRKAGSRSRSST